MERPKISDYTKDLLASYDQLSDFSCSQDKYIDQLESQLKEVKKEDEAWSLIEVLKKLIMSADILLIKKDYDGRYHEEIKTARDVAERIVSDIR